MPPGLQVKKKGITVLET